MIALACCPISVPAFTAARSMSPVESWTSPCLAAIALACVPLPAPGGPSRIRFITASRRPPELRLLDQAFVLVRQQMALHLRHRIHGHADGDQQRGAAEVERHRGVGDQQLRQHAHDRQVDGADHRDARQHVVDVLGRLGAGPDARQEAAVLAQVVGRLLRVEHDGRVEEGEEHDQRHVDQRDSSGWPRPSAATMAFSHSGPRALR